ncbi:G-protein coupled receptor [Branchiostoma belcheri]|nr:G-protein coupled receptor [Branchiostoma belcheri]
MCRVNPMIQGISVAASVYTMTAIAYDRYKAIVFPTEPRMSLTKMRYALAGIWISAVAVMVPQVFVLQVETFYPTKTVSVNASASWDKPFDQLMGSCGVATECSTRNLEVPGSSPDICH